MIRQYVVYECPTCGHRIKVRVRRATITCPHPNHPRHRPELMKPKELV